MDVEHLSCMLHFAPDIGYDAVVQDRYSGAANGPASMLTHWQHCLALPVPVAATSRLGALAECCGLCAAGLGAPPPLPSSSRRPCTRPHRLRL